MGELGGPAVTDDLQASAPLCDTGLSLSRVFSTFGWHVVAPAEFVELLELLFDIGAFVKRHEAAHVSGLTGSAIGELGVAVQARAGGVGPRAVQRFPCRNDPSGAIR